MEVNSDGDPQITTVWGMSIIIEREPNEIQMVRTRNTDRKTQTKHWKSNHHERQLRQHMEPLAPKQPYNRAANTEK